MVFIKRRNKSWSAIIVLLMLGVVGLIRFLLRVGSIYENYGFLSSQFQTRLISLYFDIILITESIAAIIRRVKDEGRQANNGSKYVFMTWISVAVITLFGIEFTAANSYMVYKAHAAGESISGFDIMFIVIGVIAAAVGIFLGIMKLRRQKKSGN